jgi:hypothetical protein
MRCPDARTGYTWLLRPLAWRILAVAWSAAGLGTLWVRLLQPVASLPVMVGAAMLVVTWTAAWYAVTRLVDTPVDGPCRSALLMGVIVAANGMSGGSALLAAAAAPAAASSVQVLALVLPILFVPLAYLAAHAPAGGSPPGDARAATTATDPGADRSGAPRSLDTLLDEYEDRQRRRGPEQ